MKEIQAISPLRPGRTKVCLALLAGRGIVARSGGDHYRLLMPGLSREAIAAAGRSYRDKEEQDLSTLKQMIDYAAGGGCRWQALLRYFDDDALLIGPCLHCDNDPTVADETARLATLRDCVQALAASEKQAV